MYIERKTDHAGNPVYQLTVTVNLPFPKDGDPLDGDRVDQEFLAQQLKLLAQKAVEWLDPFQAIFVGEVRSDYGPQKALA